MAKAARVRKNPDDDSKDDSESDSSVLHDGLPFLEEVCCFTKGEIIFLFCVT
jgi:hypothetical protein